MVATDETELRGRRISSPTKREQTTTWPKENKPQPLQVYLSRSHVKGPGNMAGWWLYSRNWQRSKGPVRTQSRFLKLHIPVSTSHHCGYLKEWICTPKRQTQLLRAVTWTVRDWDTTKWHVESVSLQLPLGNPGWWRFERKIQLIIEDENAAFSLLE